MSDIIDELAALERSSAEGITAAPVHDPAVQIQPDPTPGGTVESVIDLNGNPIRPAAAPAPVTINLDTNGQPIPQDPAAPPAPAAPTVAQPPATPATPAPAPTESAPAPAAPVVPEVIDRRYYTKHLPEQTQMLMAVASANPGLSPSEVANIVNARLGLPTAPAAPAAPADPAPAEPADKPAELTLQTAQERVNAIATEIAEIDPVLDSKRYAELTAEAMRLNSQIPVLAQQHQQQAAQQQDSIEATIAANWAQATNSYPALADRASPLRQAYDQQMAAFEQSNHPLFSAPDAEILVAQMVAGRLGIAPAPIQSAPAAASVPGQQPTAPQHPAAPQPAAPAVQQQHAPGQAPVTVMPSVPGSVHSSADRVTTVPADPNVALDAQYQQAVAAGDYAAMEAIDALRQTGGQRQPQMPALQISVAGSAY